MKTYWKSCMRATGKQCGRKLSGGVKLLILLTLLLSLATATPSATYSQELRLAATTTAIDTVRVLADEVRLLEVDLWEARALARIDSIYAAEQLRLQREMYEARIRAIQAPWYERMLKHPVVWVSIHTDHRWMDEQYPAGKARDVHRHMRDMGYVGTHLATDHEEHWRYDPK